MMMEMKVMMMLMTMVKAGLGVLVLDMQSAAGASVWLALHKPPPLPCLVSSESLTGSEFMCGCVWFSICVILCFPVCMYLCVLLCHGITTWQYFRCFVPCPWCHQAKGPLDSGSVPKQFSEVEPGNSHLPRWIDLVPEVNNLRGKYDWYADKKSPRCDQSVRSHFLNLWSVFDL